MGAPYNVFGASGLEGAKAGLPQMIIYYQYLQNEITRNPNLLPQNSGY
jgi:hypothetical protein